MSREAPGHTDLMVTPECECGKKPDQTCHNPDCHQPPQFFRRTWHGNQRESLMKIHDETIQIVKDWVVKP